MESPQDAESLARRMAYRIRQGRHFNVPKPGLTYTETFLYLLDHLGEEDYKPHPVVAKALDVLFILHGERDAPCGVVICD